MIVIVCFAFALWLGFWSNKDRTLLVPFNIFTGPFAGVAGAILGFLTIEPAFSFRGVVTGFILGLFAGLLGLLCARISE